MRRWCGLAVPVEGGEDDERVRAAEVDPEEAARRRRSWGRSRDGEVAVVVGGDGAGAGEEGARRLRRGGVLRVPQMACGCLKVVVEEVLEAGVERGASGLCRWGRAGCTARATGGRRRGRRWWACGVARGRGDEVVGVGDLGVGGRGSGEEESGGELEVVCAWWI